MHWSDFKPEAGKFLLSEPTMADPNFARTVVLLVEHGEEGSVGFVMNRPLEIQLSDVSEDFVGLDFPLFEGGPVQLETLHYVHRIKNMPGAQELCPGVFWGGDFEFLKTLLPSTLSSDIRFYLGYSGWGPDQLKAEQETRAWLSAAASPEMVFDGDPETLWERIVREQGGDVAGLANYPRDPSWN